MRKAIHKEMYRRGKFIKKERKPLADRNWGRRR
jgi:hypothetical protein